jgi:hypothetical protein
MKLFISGFIFFLALFLAPCVYARTNDEIREELVVIARERAFNSRLQREANRLGVAWDRSRIYAVRLVLLVFGDESRTALAVAKAESGLRCGAVGDGGRSIGLFQINEAHWGRWSRDSLFDCEVNIKAAYQIWEESGFWPWTVFRLGAYRQFL